VDGDPVFSVVKQVLSNGQQLILNSLSASRSNKFEPGTNADAIKAHIDTRMPAPDFGHTESAIAMICVDDFTVENGAVRVWPYSHLTGMRPPPEVDTADLPGALQVCAPRGSVIYWLGQTWHSISRNLSGARRWGIISHHTYWWIKPTFDYTYCGAELYARLTPEQKGLLGFNSRPPASPDIRIFTVTKAHELPDDYEAAMRPDYSRGQKPATAHKSADSKA
jgi:ectoine hydroxylase-related dioxygenase (phytanoyl-CoA dioxygenase family)